jgi:LPS-assembly protein
MRNKAPQRSLLAAAVLLGVAAGKVAAGKSIGAPAAELPAAELPAAEAAAPAKSPPAKKSSPKLSITADRIHGTGAGESTVFENNVVATLSNFTLGETRIEAARATVKTTRAGDIKKTPLGTVAVLHGESKITAGPLRLLAESPTVTVGYDKKGDPETVRLDTQLLRFGMPPGYVQGTALNAAKSATTASTSVADATLYYQEPDFWSISVTADKVTVEAPVAAEDKGQAPAATEKKKQKSKDKERKKTGIAAVQTSAADATLHVEGATVRVAGVPLLYIPSYTQHGLELPPVRPIVRAGQKNSTGTYLRTTTYYTGFGKAFQPGALLDAYTKAGALVGPALDYDWKADKKSTAGNTAGTAGNAAGTAAAAIRGDFQAAWINDNSFRGTDDYDRPIHRHRAFVWWRHKQEIPFSFLPADSNYLPRSLELSANVHYWSDTAALRDFRPDMFDENQRPDNFVELVAPAPAYYLSLFTRFRPNQFQNVQQRLPELRFDLNPQTLFATGNGAFTVRHRFNAAFAYLVEQSSPALPSIAGNADDGILESRRFDAYYGLDAPLKLGDFCSLTPVAGVRATTYFDSIANGQNAGDTTTRLVPQFGFDFHLLANGQWSTRNDFWEINGLRHLLRPLVQYRFLPDATRYAAKIPPVDRDTFITYPPTLDLSQKRNADDLWEVQTLRIGVENILQTRDTEYGSRNLLWLNIYQDFRDLGDDSTRTAAGTRYRSTLYSQLGLAPAYWLSLNAYHRLDTYNGNSNEISIYADIHDGDRWRLYVGYQYCTDVIVTNQCYWGGEYRLNSNYTLLGRWRFDNRAGDLTEQRYGLRQRLGNTWEIEWYLRYRRDARRDSGLSFGATLRLARF